MKQKPEDAPIKGTPEALAQLGAYLRFHRELRSYSLEDVGRAIRIRPEKLAELESGDFETLPRMPFVLGIIQAYGKYVGCDGETLQGKITEALEPAPKVDLSGISKPQDVELTRVDRSSFYITQRMVLTAVSIVAFLVLVWMGLDYVSLVLTKRTGDSGQAIVVSAPTQPKSTPPPPPISPTAAEKPQSATYALMVRSKIPNYVKVSVGKDNPKLHRAFVGPLQPFQLYQLNQGGVLWSLYPRALEVLVDGKPLTISWKGQLGTFALP